MSQPCRVEVETNQYHSRLLQPVEPDYARIRAEDEMAADGAGWFVEQCGVELLVEIIDNELTGIASAEIQEKLIDALERKYA